MFCDTSSHAIPSHFDYLNYPPYLPQTHLNGSTPTPSHFTPTQVAPNVPPTSFVPISPNGNASSSSFMGCDATLLEMLKTILRNHEQIMANQSVIEEKFGALNRSYCDLMDKVGKMISEGAMKTASVEFVSICEQLQFLSEGMEIMNRNVVQIADELKFVANQMG